VGLELHAQDLAGQRGQLGHGSRQLHATALAAATGVDLGLDDPDRAAQLLGGFLGFAHAERGMAPRHRHAVRAQQFLGLVFVDLHRGSSFEGGAGAAPATPGASQADSRRM
jgi:hypothetical protein